MRKTESKLSFLGYPITFMVVLFAWIFFRAQDLKSATSAIKNILSFDFNNPYIGDLNVVVTSLFVLILGLGFDFYLRLKNEYLETVGKNLTTLQIALFSSIVITLINLFYSTSNNFIYFQF